MTLNLKSTIKGFLEPLKSIKDTVLLLSRISDMDPLAALFFFKDSGYGSIYIENSGFGSILIEDSGYGFIFIEDSGYGSALSRI